MKPPEINQRERVISSVFWLVVSVPLLVVGITLSRDLGVRSVQALVPLGLFTLCVFIAFLIPVRWRIALSNWLPWF
jgi:hypothetical protein